MLPEMCNHDDYIIDYPSDWVIDYLIIIIIIEKNFVITLMIIYQNKRPKHTFYIYFNVFITYNIINL